MERKKNLGFPRSSLCLSAVAAATVVFRALSSFHSSLGRLVLTTPTSICLALQTSRSIIALFPSPPSPPRAHPLDPPRPSPITGVTRYRAVSECDADPPPSLPPISYCRGTGTGSVPPMRVCKRVMFLRTCVRLYVCVRKKRTARTGRGRVIIIRGARGGRGRR